MLFEVFGHHKPYLQQVCQQVYLQVCQQVYLHQRETLHLREILHLQVYLHLRVALLCYFEDLNLDLHMHIMQARAEIRARISCLTHLSC
jgi:hypothetical protein